MDYLNQLEKIIESGHRIITVETDEVDRVYDFLLEISYLSTKPYYLAEAGKAMHRLGASHIDIPRTQNPAGLIEHIVASKHFAIFILQQQDSILSNDILVKKLISVATSETHKIVILLAKKINLPSKLTPFAVRATHKLKNSV